MYIRKLTALGFEWFGKSFSFQGLWSSLFVLSLWALYQYPVDSCSWSCWHTTFSLTPPDFPKYIEHKIEINKCFHNVNEWTENYHVKWDKLKFILYSIINKVWLYFQPTNFVNKPNFWKIITTNSLFFLNPKATISLDN